MAVGEDVASEEEGREPPGSPACARPPGGWLSAGVLLTVLFAYLIGESRTPPYIDSKQLYDVAESIVYRGSIQIPPSNGVLYAQHPFLASAIHLPGVVLRKAIAGGEAEVDRLIKPLTSHLGSQIVAAIGCLVFLRLLLFLGVSRLGGSLGTLMLAFSTLLPIYARSAWSEALQTTAFLGLFSAVVRLHREPRRPTAVWLGVWAGIVVNAKYVFVLALAGAVVWLCLHAWRSRQLRAYLRAGLWSCLGGAPFLLLALWYNHARSPGGSAVDSGYAPVQTLVVSVFRENPLLALWSQFFSLGKSILLYSPPLLLALVILLRSRRSRAACLWAAGLMVVPVLLLYSKFPYWGGDWCWGPRYQLFLVPPLLLFGVLALDEALQKRRVVALVAWGTLFCAGVWVQVAGASQYWDHFIRVSKTVQADWLGWPNRTGAFVPTMRGQCDPCFEDLYARTYTPAFQPIEAHSWFLWHHLKGDPWEVAARDMPLARYTSLSFPIVKSWYENPPWDWWKLSFVGRFRAAGNWLMALFVAGFLAGGAMWLRGLRGRWWLGRRKDPTDGSRPPQPEEKAAPAEANAAGPKATA